MNLSESQKKLEKKRRTQATQPVGTPNFLRYLANFRAAIADQNWEYGTLKLIADTDRISPMYNPYGKSIGRWCVFGADGWTFEQSNSLH
jgi:hypothetical protein